MSRVRVLQVLTCDALGGTELMTARLIERLDASSVETELVTLSSPGPIADRLRRQKIAVLPLGDRGFVRALFRLAKILRGGRYDVVNAYGFKACLMVRFMVAILSSSSAFVCGVRSLHPSELENLHGFKARFVLTIERLTRRWVTVYDANSRGALELLASVGVPREKLLYIPNGIDVLPLDASADRDNDPAIVLCVARFVARKRHADLVVAARMLTDRGLSFRMVLVGKGPTLEPIRDMIRDLDLRDVVEVPGALHGEALDALLCRSDIFCLVSTFEGMPGSVMEAMERGIPVAGTRVNGIEDLVVHGDTGLLVPPKEPPTLADALQALLSDAELRRQMGSAGRRRIAGEFTLEQMVRSKQRLFESLAIR